MKALSLTQPWASLVAIGAKRIETRSWPTLYRGPIAIHASKVFPKWARETCWDDPFRTVLKTAGLVDFRGYQDLLIDSVERYALPLGAIVAVARLVETVHTGDMGCYERTGCEIPLGQRGTWNVTPQEFAFGDYAPGRFAWCLADVKRLPEPIPCRGALGLWNVPEDIARQLEAL